MMTNTKQTMNEKCERKKSLTSMTNENKNTDTAYEQLCQ